MFVMVVKIIQKIFNIRNFSILYCKAQMCGFKSLIKEHPLAGQIIDCLTPGWGIDFLSLSPKFERVYA